MQTQMHPHHSFKGIIWIIVVLIVLGLIAWGLMQLAPLGSGIDDEEDGVGITEVIEELPEEFIIEFDTLENGQEVPRVAESYKEVYGDVKLLVVRYTSAISLLDSTIAYARVLSDGGWSVTSVPSDELGVGETTRYKATREGEAVDISFHKPETDLIDVTIAYSRAVR